LSVPGKLPEISFTRIESNRSSECTTLSPSSRISVQSILELQRVTSAAIDSINTNMHKQYLKHRSVKVKNSPKMSNIVIISDFKASPRKEQDINPENKKQPLKLELPENIELQDDHEFKRSHSTKFILGKPLNDSKCEFEKFQKMCNKITLKCQSSKILNESSSPKSESEIIDTERPQIRNI